MPAPRGPVCTLGLARLALHTRPCTLGLAHPALPRCPRALLAAGKRPAPAPGVPIETARRWLEMPSAASTTKIHSCVRACACARVCLRVHSPGSYRRGWLPRGICPRAVARRGPARGPGDANSQPREPGGGCAGLCVGAAAAPQGCGVRDWGSPSAPRGWICPSEAEAGPAGPGLAPSSCFGYFPPGRIRRGAAPRCTGPPG